jgi:DNA-binding Lrp family transcriptional regulator
MRIKGKRTLTVLDNLDKQIIQELQIDGRQSNIKIGKKISTSEGTIRNRSRQLLKKEFIKIVAALNLPQLGFDLSVIIGLEVAIENLPEVEKTVARSPYIVFLANSTGNYNLMGLALFRGLKELDNFMKGMIHKLPGIKKAETFIMWSVIKNSWVSDPNLTDVL